VEETNKPLTHSTSQTPPAAPVHKEPTPLPSNGTPVIETVIPDKQKEGETNE
jgi:hypothetical protein